MKRIALAVAVAVLLVPQAYAGPWLKSLSAAQQKAKDGNKLIFVDMFADWCGWCHRMEQEVFPSQAFQSATDDLVLLRLNTEDGADGSKLAQRFQVTSLPTFLLITPDMTIAGIIRGYAPPNDFVKSVKDSETRYNDFNSRVKGESSFAKDYQKRLDLAREFTQRYALPQSETRFKALTAEHGAPADIRDQAYYELAVSQIMQKKYADAIKTVSAFGKIQSKGEPYERSRLLLAQAYMEQGNMLGAVNELKKFKQTFPGSKLVGNVDMILPDLERRLAGKNQ
ncbi:MAG TPA: thioredoxin fold domain-containing protein [Thermoanaerobaculia bacterium]|nr:thioredoxin fold domain-containing protein [Thermoanaerobaculia bacterium]